MSSEFFYVCICLNWNPRSIIKYLQVYNWTKMVSLDWGAFESRAGFSTSGPVWVSVNAAYINLVIWM